MAQTLRVQGRHTTVFTDIDGMTKVIYHQTVVVAFDQDKIVLNSGGYHTLTTKLRMNQASNQYRLGYVVFQKDYGWYVEHNGSTVDFYDGMELPRD